MSKRSGFYLTLPSDASMDLFPDNTMASYMTKLPNALHLEGEWELALVEMIYTSSFYNVRQNYDPPSEKISVDDVSDPPKKKRKKTSKTTEIAEGARVQKYCVPDVPPGHYQSIEHLIGLINETEICKSTFACLYYDKTTGRVSLKPNYSLDILPVLSLSRNIADILGFEDHNNVSGTAKNEARIDVHVPSQLYVYVDIAENEIVGDTLVPLLRIVPVENDNSSHGKTIVKTFDFPHYVPLAKKYFDTLTMDIRDHLGQPTPFAFGTLSCKIHLRCVERRD